MIRFACPACGSVLHAADGQTGATTPCLACGQPVLIPPPVRAPKLGIPLPAEPDDAKESHDESSGEANYDGALDHALPNYRRSIWPRVMPLFAFFMLLLLFGGAVYGFIWFRSERQKMAQADSRHSTSQRTNLTKPKLVDEVEQPKGQKQAPKPESVFDRWDLPDHLDLPPSQPIPDDERRPGWNGEFHRQAREFVIREFSAIKTAAEFATKLPKARHDLQILIDVKDDESLVKLRKALPRLSKELHAEYESAKSAGDTAALAKLIRVAEDFDQFSQDVDAAARAKR